MCMLCSEYQKGKMTYRELFLAGMELLGPDLSAEERAHIEELLTALFMDELKEYNAVL